VPDREFSKAVVAYYSVGKSSYPKADPEAVAAALKRSDPFEVLDRIRALENEMFSIEVDWTTLGWQGGCDLVQATMRDHHPELTSKALEALDWQFSYSTR
jgi:hypothetical protein